jgi:hypothetical protein
MDERVRLEPFALPIELQRLHADIEADLVAVAERAGAHLAYRFKWKMISTVSQAIRDLQLHIF